MLQYTCLAQQYAVQAGHQWPVRRPRPIKQLHDVQPVLLVGRLLLQMPTTSKPLHSAVLEHALDCLHSSHIHAAYCLAVMHTIRRIIQSMHFVAPSSRERRVADGAAARTKCRMHVARLPPGSSTPRTGNAVFDKAEQVGSNTSLGFGSCSV